MIARIDRRSARVRHARDIAGRRACFAEALAKVEGGRVVRLGQEAPRIVSTLNLVAAGLGVAMVPASLQHMRVDGVYYCALRGAVQLKALLAVASRRGDPSATVRQFLKVVARMAAPAVRA